MPGAPDKMNKTGHSRDPVPARAIRSWGYQSMGLHPCPSWLMPLTDVFRELPILFGCITLLALVPAPGHHDLPCPPTASLLPPPFCSLLACPCVPRAGRIEPPAGWCLGSTHSQSFHAGSSTCGLRWGARALTWLEASSPVSLFRAC